MLFLGTKTYPTENEYSSFLNSHGGFSNAYTGQENTVYYFDVQSDSFEEALNMFAAFFICPLFTESATEREVNAVDSENTKNLQADNWRQYQLLKRWENSWSQQSCLINDNFRTIFTVSPSPGIHLIVFLRAMLRPWRLTRNLLESTFVIAWSSFMTNITVLTSWKLQSMARIRW